MKFIRAFTLIELLVVIGIMAILAAGVVTLIDPVDKAKQANDSRVQAVIADVATAEVSYAAQHGGCYTNSWANLNAAGELNLVAAPLPVASPVYVLTFTTVPGGCTAPEVGTVTVSAVMQSKKYTGSSTQIWQWQSASGKTCGGAAIGSGCP